MDIVSAIGPGLSGQARPGHSAWARQRNFRTSASRRGFVNLETERHGHQTGGLPGPRLAVSSNVIRR
jgi:hypothetical protein